MCPRPHARLRRYIPLAVALAFVTALPDAALAQPGMGGMGPGMGPMGGGAGGPGQRQEKKEGPAEAAPKDKQALRPIDPVPALPERQRRIQLFELGGYFRTRGDYFHRLDLGLPIDTPYDGIDTDNKFFRPPAQTPEPGATDDEGLAPNDVDCLARLTEQGVPIDKRTRRCRRRNGFASANLRLRLEPTLHITDTVKVHAQIDVLDNLVMGSTPDTYAWDHPNSPMNLYTRTQTVPTAGRNTFRDSILAKRAWMHIRFGWGLDLRAGRMPWHWGMGIVANDGNGYRRGEHGDIVRMLDTDYGDSVDSIRLSYDFGKDRRKTHTLALSWDWAASGPTTAQLLGPQYDSGGIIGQDFSAEKFDNLYQWSLSIERRDDPDMLRRKLSLGAVVVNYGFMNWLRFQSVDAEVGTPGFGDGLGTNPDYYGGNSADDRQPGGDPLGNGELDADSSSGLTNYARALVYRRSILYTPDLWLRVNWRTLRIELEAAGQLGRFYSRDLDDGISGPAEITGLEIASLGKSVIRSFGYALEFKYGMFQDKFHVGLDNGFASGDESSNVDHNYLNPQLVDDDGTISNFRFNPAYTIDVLLFRELLGTVSNVAYFKPWAAFYFFDYNFSARVDVGYALAQQRQSTYGNRNSYGLELNAAFRYHSSREPIYFQLQYGVMFPFGAFNRPPAIYGDGVTQFGSGDAKAAQTIQAQVGVRF